MLTQSSNQDIVFTDDRDIQNLYDRLGIGTEEQRTQEMKSNGGDGYWPPIPVYSIRFSSEEDLSR